MRIPGGGRVGTFAGGLLTIMALLGFTGLGCASRSPVGLDVIPIKVGQHTIRAEVAIEADDQSRGLMYRRELKRNAGMLFVYEQPARLSFWMKNTFVPLSIAFIDDAGLIVHIEDMAPQTRTSHKSPKPVRYALEVNRGWFGEHGITSGSRAEFELPAAR